RNVQLERQHGAHHVDPTPGPREAIAIQGHNRDHQQDQLSRDQATKSLRAGITVSGASSINQWPEPLTIWPRTSEATSLACSMRNEPPAFSPERTSMGMESRVRPIRAKSSASRSKLRKYSKPARMAPGCA